MTHTQPSSTLRAHLLRRLTQLPPASTWPADRPPPQPEGGGYERLKFTLPPPTAEEVRNLAVRLRVPVISVFSACLQALLYRVRTTGDGADGEDVVIAVGACRQLPGDWFPLRQMIDVQGSFAELVLRAGAEYRETLAHLERYGPYPITALAADNGIAVADMLRVVLVLDDGTPGSAEMGFTPDLVFTLSGSEGTLEFAVGHYASETGSRILASYLELLGNAVRTPDQAIGGLPVVPSAADAAGAWHADGTSAGTPIERVVAEVWAEALCRDWVGIHADLFEIGGNSRTAVEVSALLSEIFRVPIPIRLLFDLPTVAGQAARLAELDSSCPHSLTDIARRLLTYDVEVVVER